MGKFIDRTGHRYGRWLVLARSPRKANGWPKRRIAFWICRCDCGTESEVAAGNLANGASISCGCYQREMPSRLKHGDTRNKVISSEYTVWSNMKRRCLDPNNEAFRNYGGRGIKVCERWLQFENFLADMGRRPPEKTLHRKDNDGNYELENCIWATDEEQANAKQNSFYVEISGRTQTFTQWCNELNLNFGTAYDRIVRGWNPVDALLKPVKQGNYRRGPRARAN